MKKIIAGLTGITAFLAALPVLAAIETGIGYGTIIGLGTRDVREMTMYVIQILMSFLGIVAIIIILIGGFRWMVSGGNEEKVAAAKALLLSGIIGLIIILAAYALASFIVNSLVAATY